METAELIQIQSQFKELEKLIRELAENKIVKPEAMQSENIGELAAALSVAQGKFKKAHKNKVGCHAEYADLEELLKSIEPGMSNEGLCFTQDLIEYENGLWLYTCLMHKGGQWKKGKIRVLPNKGDIQSLGSQITFLRRYTLSSMLGILGDREDDDAELLRTQEDVDKAQGTSLKEQARKIEIEENKTVIKTLSQESLEELDRVLRGWPDLARELKEVYGVRSLADIEQRHFFDIRNKALIRIEAIKNSRS